MSEHHAGIEDGTASNDAGEAMHIHKPHPIHGWREFLKEYGIIVLGVLTALALEQAVESIHWAHKVETVERGLDYELQVDAGFAYRLRVLRPCAERSAELMQVALTEGRPELLQAVYRPGEDDNPVDPRPWQVAAWDTAQAGDVVSHLDPARTEAYALDFRLIATERELQWKLQDAYADVMSARYGVAGANLTAPLQGLERYRITGLTAYQAAGHFLTDVKALGIAPDAQAIRAAQTAVQACEARVAAALAPPTKAVG